MKTSYYRAPRTLAECEFTVGYAIANYAEHRYRQGMFVIWLAIICVIAGLGIAFSVDAARL